MRILRRAEEGIPFIEILLDETLCSGEVGISKELVRSAGGVNRQLSAKLKYELVLRIAKETPIVLEEFPDGEYGLDVMKLEDDASDVEDLGWQTDCYIIGKYSEELRKAGCFDMAVEGILQEAQANGKEEIVIAWLEQMIGHAEAFYKIDDATRPILIYKGDPICYNVLTVFAEQLGKALERAGEHVIYFDLEQEDVSGILQYVDQRFKAVIGVQSYLFSVKLADEKHYVHEYIYGPKYNFVFDHPIWFEVHLMHNYPEYYLLVPDQNYADFAKRYFHKEAILFPPAGMQLENVGTVEWKYDLTFVGTMGDYLQQAMWIHTLKRENRFLANRFLLTMRQNPDMTLEEAFTHALEHQGIVLTDEAFMERLRDLRTVGYCVMHYYRYKVVETLLKAGIRLDVFGDSWQASALRKYPNLVCHPDITVEESLLVWKQSKLSLNVMSWHKSGFTERMAGIMMAGAVLVTDDTRYLKGRYEEEDMLIFQLSDLEKLPEKVKGLLADEEKRQRIAENGRRKTICEHTWEKRAEQFLELLRDRH